MLFKITTLVQPIQGMNVSSKIVSASDEIVNNPRAEDICRKLAGRDWKELFQSSWLEMKEQELKGNKINSAIDYFYFIALSKSKYRKTRVKKKIDIVFSDDITFYEIPQEEQADSIKHIQDVVKKYLEKETNNLIDKFYQDFCKAILTFNSISEAQKGMNICRTTFWILLNQLQEDLKNEI